MASDPTMMTWTWPTTATDQSGAVVNLPLSDIAAVEIQFDGGAIIDVTSVTGQSGPQAALKLSSLDQFKALKPGQHTVAVAARTVDGTVGGFTSPVSFLVVLVPAAPTALVVG